MAGQRLSRRDFLRMGALATAGAVLAGCAPKAAEKAAEATAPPPGVQKVTVFTGFGTGTDASQIEVHDTIIKEFNGDHPDVQIEWLTVPWGEHVAKYSTMLAAGMTPEMAGPIGVGGVAEFWEGWVDLSPYIEADNYDMSDYFGLTQEIHTYAGQGVLGLPLCVYPSVVFYNEDLFDAAGVDYPPHKFGESDWTYDKQFEIAKLLTIDSAGNDANSPAFKWEDTTQWGWNGWDWMGIREVGAKWGGKPRGVSDDNRTAVFNSPEYVKGVQAIADTTWKTHIWANGEQGGAFYDVAGDPFGSGMVGAWEIHSWMGWAYGSWTESFNWDVAAVPMVAEVGKPIAVVDADTYVMSKTAKNPDAAWQAMKWLFEPAQFDRLCKNYSCIPARKTLAATWVSGQQAQFPDVDFQVFLDSLDYIDRPNHEAWLPEYKRVGDACTKAWDLLRTGENLNVEEVLASLSAEAQGYIDEYWAANP